MEQHSNFVPPEAQQPLYRGVNRPENPYNRRALFFTGNVLGVGMLGYLLMSLLFSLMLRSFPALKDMYLNEPLYTYLLEILYSYLCVGLPFFIVFIILKRTRLYEDLKVPYGAPYRKGEALLLVPAALGLCFLGSLASNYLAAYADAFGFGFLSYYEAMETEPVPAGILGITVLTLRSAVVPALLEEFAFRGVVLQSLRRYGDWFAIAVSAVMFGLVHGNLTQMPFAIIAGLALGYCAVITGSLRSGIAIHFLNNFVSVIVTLVSYYIGEGQSLVVSNCIIYGGIGVGLVMLVIFLVRKPNSMRLRPGRNPGLRGKARAVFLAPTVIISIGWLLWYTLNDISAFAKWLGVG